ncbi:MAG: hypothetical protein ACAI38_16690 [Myxococcota bacterium]|nr:hypothetical protein [Myxococcota bacterium]
MHAARAADDTPIAWLPELEAALVCVAEVLVVLMLLRQQTLELTGISLHWWALVAPALVASVLASFSARFSGTTALPFGPNAVFVLAFARGLGPASLGMCSPAGGSDCGRELAGLFTAALLVYAAMVALLTLLILRLRLEKYRRVLLMPLAAICWTYLVVAPALKVAAESIAVIVPTAVLLVMLLAGVRKFAPWLVAGALWFALAWLTNDFPQPNGAHAAAMVPGFSGSVVWSWLARWSFWMDALPLVAPIAIANAFGIIENLAAAREIGDHPSASHTLGIVTIGTLTGAALGTAAPLTVYVGHTAFHRRGARWVYGLCMVPLLCAMGMFGHKVADLLPASIFFGATAYVGVTVGLLPRRHLESRADVARLIMVAIPVLTAAFARVTHPIIAWVARGGGLTAVGWAFLAFAEPWSVAQEGAAWAMAVASLLGIVHAQPLTWTSYCTAAVYVALALAARVLRSRHSAMMRG